MPIAEQRTSPPTLTVRGGVALLTGALLFAAACGGSGRTTPPAARSDAGAALGRAESATPAAAVVAPTPAPAAAALTSAPPAAAPGSATRQGPAPSPARAGSAAAPGSNAAVAVATPHPDTPNPCGLVTQTEAETALGGRPIAGQVRRSRDSAEMRCTYDSLAVGRTAVVAVWKGAEARSVYDLRRSAYGQGATVEEIRGLGDRAFVVKGDEGWVNILKGDVYMSIQVANQTPAAEQGLHGQELRERTLVLARAALGRL